MSSSEKDLQQKKDKAQTYSNLYYTTALLHGIYYLVFTFEKCRILSRINALMIITYIILGVVIRKAVRFNGLFTVATVAMTVFLTSHYVLLGPSFGFQYLCIAMVPLMFYMAYVNGAGVEISRRGSIALFIVLCLVTFACARINYPLAIAPVSEITRRVMAIANLCLTFIIVIQFLTELVKQTYTEADALENKNLDLEQSANIDALTGLLNRRSLETYINKTLHSARGLGRDFSFLMCDIDNFKKVNDTYGHDCGDQVLQNIASIIKGEVRPDDAVFRWGGEEILVVVNAGGYVAKNVAERCRKAVEESYVMYNDEKIAVTVTIGGVSYYQGATRDDLINRADKNLYEGKQNGKNQVVM